MNLPTHDRRFSMGAELRESGVHFRVWATAPSRVVVVLQNEQGSRDVALAAEGDGWHSALVEGARAGDRYRFRLDDQGPYPDPASRFQPEGPHEASQVVDPDAFAWTDQDWRGPARFDQVIYEMHVGTFTKAGTFAAATAELSELARLGITMIEVMPIAEFPGEFGWGYDGVDLFAPYHGYGSPDEVRAFVDAAHREGLAVILDVVYNHFGPSGNYLKCFAPEYFTDRYENEWGEALSFDGDRSAPVRDLFVSNARYWITEFHFDGLRLDATQSIHDASPRHIIAEITQAVRDAAGSRRTFVVAENEPQDARLVREPSRGGHGLDALWNDDFHHCARVALDGSREAYYQDYLGSPQELLSAAKHGFLYQGQRYRWQNARRGRPAFDLDRARHVAYLQNHDQVANSARGARIDRSASPAKLRAMTALLLLAPATPMLFQGQEFGASAPFLYFADHEPELSDKIKQGRKEFLAQFPSIATPEVAALLADPRDRRTFARCQLDLTERETHAEAYALHRDLLRLRREDPLLRQGAQRPFDGAVLGPHAFVLRWFADHDREPSAVDLGDRLLVVNLGADLALDGHAEPLLAPPESARWTTRWSSEDARYGGRGTPTIDVEGGPFRLLAQSAVVLVPERSESR